MLKDIQNERDYRNIEIDKVGVKDLKYPIIVLDKVHKRQHTIANVNMYVELPHYFKGTHMSRFIEVLNKYRGEITSFNVHKILEDMKKTLNARRSHLELEFPYFIEKAAPVTGAKGIMETICKFTASSNEKVDFILTVKVPIMTLCPCSKEISRYNAHNQRGTVTISIRFDELVWIEDLIDLAERCSSSAIYSLLKREDEKFVTEKAYENPMFVEDVVRCISEKFLTDDNIIWFAIEAENIESIHNHSAYAFIERDKRKYKFNSSES